MCEKLIKGKWDPNYLKNPKRKILTYTLECECCAPIDHQSRMESSTEIQSSTQRFIKITPESRGKLRTSIQVIDITTPWRLTIQSTYSLANLDMLYLVFTRMNWANFVNLLRIIQIESYSTNVHDSPTTKSMVTLSHFH